MIPKVFHRLHLGPGRLPRTVKDWDKQLLALNPGWELRYWRPDDLPEMRNQELYDLSTNIGHRADIARFEILYRRGGVYIDWDMEPRAAMPDLSNVSAFCGQTKPINYAGAMFDTEIAILGCEAGHAFFDYLLGELTPWAILNLNRECVLRTGPWFYHLMLQEWESQPRPSEAGVKCFPTHVFYPVSPAEKSEVWKVHGGASFVHHWWGSWSQGAINGGHQWIADRAARAALSRLFRHASCSTATPMPNDLPASPQG